MRSRLEPMKPRTVRPVTSTSAGPNVPGHAVAAATKAPHEAYTNPVARRADQITTPRRSRSSGTYGTNPRSIAASNEARGETSSQASNNIAVTPTANAPTGGAEAIKTAAATAVAETRI